MPRIGFATENRAESKRNYDYPKLSLKNGERARVVVGLEDPLMEYVHTLQKPLIVNGVAQKETKTRRNGTTYEDYAKEFITRAICLGDKTILDESGADPKNCPMCKFAKDYPDYAQAPQRRYAMHVIRYRTKSGGFDLATPFSVEILVWAFTDTVFNKFIDFAEEHGDIRKKDLLLGPCTNEGFQKFDIGVGSRAEWLSSPENKQIVLETFKENRIKDLTVAIGSSKQKQWIQQDIETVLEAWEQVLGAAPSESSSSLDEDLGSLFDGGKSPDRPAVLEDDALPAEDSDDLLAGLDEFAGEPEDSDEVLADLDLDVAPAEEAPAPKAESKKSSAKAPAPSLESESEPDVDNFDDLLAGLGDD